MDDMKDLEQSLKTSISVSHNFKHISYAEKIAWAYQELMDTDPNLIIKRWREERDNILWGIYTGKVYLVLNGEKYEYDKNETILLDGWYIFMKKIGPLNTLRTKLVFKIPNEQNINLFWMPFQRYPNDLYTLK